MLCSLVGCLAVGQNKDKRENKTMFRERIAAVMAAVETTTNPSAPGRADTDNVEIPVAARK